MNDLYAGRIVWNKVRMVKDPVTRKRLSRPNPKDQYKVVEASHLRIVNDATFRAAQAIKVSPQVQLRCRSQERPSAYSLG